jgi:hypothetical protein
MCPDDRDGAGADDVVVIHVQGFIEADAMLAALRANGIEARTASESAGIVYGLTLDGMGETAILVRSDQAEAARELIGAAGRNELELPAEEELPDQSGER